MSVQFGKWKFDAKQNDATYLDDVHGLLIPYGPDADGAYSNGGVNILYRAFHTTKESRHETQPHISSSGIVVTWDGRLDNRSELVGQLQDALSVESTDVSIVTAAYERWGTECFAKLIGDWALSVWNPRQRTLVLAKDFAGIEHLYYAIDKEQVRWCTVLDPLVLLSERLFLLNEEFVAGFLSNYPRCHLTPYIGIYSVPPSCYVSIQEGKATTRQYWNFSPEKQTRYSTDREYEEHFLEVFADAVRRRLRSDAPIVAELSGGMDSSSIVCMADSLIAQKNADCSRLDTLSYYDDSEPNWNERPYFAKVEEKRGRAGYHVDVSSSQLFAFDTEAAWFSALPGASHAQSSSTTVLTAHFALQGYRVLLSGTGGDEALGGVPTPIPEIADLVASLQLKRLTRQLKEWSLAQRRPWMHLLFDSTKVFLPGNFVSIPKYQEPAPWLQADFVKRNWDILCAVGVRLRLCGARPSFQENLKTLSVLRNQLACTCLSRPVHFEVRYPYLDRDLLEFLYSVPREQIARPGQRRSLMRRAMVGFVPAEILMRRRKAYVARAPLKKISDNWSSMEDCAKHMISSSLGWIDSKKFLDSLHRARLGHETRLIPLLRTLSLEMWLRNLKNSNILQPDVLGSQL